MESFPKTDRYGNRIDCYRGFWRIVTPHGRKRSIGRFTESGNLYKIATKSNIFTNEYKDKLRGKIRDVDSFWTINLIQFQHLSDDASIIIDIPGTRYRITKKKAQGCGYESQWPSIPEDLWFIPLNEWQTFKIKGKKNE